MDYIYVKAFFIFETIFMKIYVFCFQRKYALSPEEMQLTLRELARFHAVSHHVLQTYPGGMTAFAEDYPFVEQGTIHK